MKPIRIRLDRHVRQAELLLSEACPSIQYRSRKELLGESTRLGSMRELQGRILEDPLVRRVMASRDEDGWLGSTFHGQGGIESGIRILCEKGVERGQPVLRDALLALERGSDRLSEGIGKVGGVLDDLGLGGSRLIRAVVFAYAGVDDRPLVKEQVAGALERMAAAADVAAVADIAEKYRDKLVFREGVIWPCIYDLRLLAWTRSWRTARHERLVTRGIRRMVELSPIPEIHVRLKSQIIAPASYCMHEFKPRLGSLSPAKWAMWFHRMEMMARLGVVRRVPALTEQVRQLRGMLADGDGLFVLPLRHGYFRNWGAYSGLMLEADWRAGTRRQSDLTFRSLVILAQSGYAA